MPILLAQEVCATRFESRAIIEAETEYFKGHFNEYFASVSSGLYESSYFVHILYINAYSDEYPVPRDLNSNVSKKKGIIIGLMIIIIIRMPNVAQYFTLGL